MENSNFTLAITLGLFCNYKCSYCHQKEIREKGGNINNTDSIMQVIDRVALLKEYIEYKISNVRKSGLCLTGGEPTLYPVYDIYNKLGIKFNYLVLDTNFSKPLNYFIDLNNKLNENGTKLHLTASFHEEFANYEEFIKKYLALVNSGWKGLKIQFTLKNSNYNYLKYLCKDIDNPNNLVVAICRHREKNNVVFEDLNGQALDTYNKYLSMLDKNSSQYISEKIRHSFDTTYGLTCTVPQNRLQIGLKGDIKYIGGCSSLGNIYESGFDTAINNLKYINEKTCESNICYCFRGFSISK